MKEYLKKITFSMDIDKAKELEQLAKDNYISISAMIRKALDNTYFKENKEYDR